MSCITHHFTFVTQPSSVKSDFKQHNTHTLHLLYLPRLEIESETLLFKKQAAQQFVEILTIQQFAWSR